MQEKNKKTKKQTPRYPVLYLGYVQMKTFTKQTSIKP